MIDTDQLAKAADRFELNISIGNDAMQEPDDIARALDRIAASIRSGVLAGNIRDDNGNRVGTFAFLLPTT